MNIKLAEKIDYEKFAILQQSEKIARMGSWEFNLLTRKLSWSDGMYTLFGIAIGTEVSLDVYLKYSSENSRITAKRILNYLYSDNQDFEETIEIVVDDQPNKILDVHATLQYDAQGRKEKIIGIDIDITAQFILQQQKEKLENKQRERESAQNLRVFWATLDAQEAERKRIAESLHENLGQLLFGLKLNLEQLDLNSPQQDLTRTQEAKQGIQLMLEDAIDECRRISYELMPITLEQYGLKVALNDLCSIFGKKIKLPYQFVGLEEQIFKPLQLAVYRFVYELLINIVNHALCSTASLKIIVTKKEIELTLEYTGTGFADKGKYEKTGLETIKNRVKLLQGRFNLFFCEEGLNVVNISIPQTAISA